MAILHRPPAFFRQNPFIQFKYHHHITTTTTTTVTTATANNNAFIYRSLFSLSSLSLSHSPTHTLPVLTKRIHSSAETAQLQSTTEQEDEFSTVRLLAQNVPWNSTPEDIRALFEKHGQVLDVELSMYNKTRNRGLAFVTMGSTEEAQLAFNSLESYEYEGRTLKLNYAKKKKVRAPPVEPKPVPTFNLFVANFSFEARAKHLKEFFDSGSDNVVSAEVIFHDNPRRSSGYGFVSFKTKKAAEEALVAFQGKMFMGRPLRVARGRQFVKLQTKEALQSASELNSSEEQEEIAGEQIADEQLDDEQLADEQLVDEQ